MGRDDRIRSDLSRRVSALTAKNGCEFSLEPAENSARSAEFAKWAERWWYRAVPESFQRRTLQDTTMLGLSYGTVSWEPIGGMWEPRLTPWPAETLWYEDEERVYKTLTSDGKIVTVEPGNGWYLHAPDGYRSWMVGAVRALGLLFVMRQLDWRDWARFNERNGMPIIAITEPPGANDAEQTAATSAFYGTLRSMGTDGVVKLPQILQGDKITGFGVDFKNPSSTSVETFRDFMRAADSAVSICLLGQDVNSEGGSYAKATAQLRPAQHLLDADSEALSTTLREQVLTPAGMWNYQNFDPDDTPWPRWSTGLPEDRSERAKVWVDFGKFLRDAKEVGLSEHLDIVEMAADARVPLLEGVERLTPQAPPAEDASKDGSEDASKDGSEDDVEDGAEEDDPEDASEAEETTARLRRGSLRALAAAAAPTARPEAPDTDGARYGTELAAALHKDLADSVRGDAEILVSLVRGARSPDDYQGIASRVGEVFDTSTSVEIAERTIAALKLAQAAGTLQHREDTSEAVVEDGGLVNGQGDGEQAATAIAADVQQSREKTA